MPWFTGFEAWKIRIKTFKIVPEAWEKFLKPRIIIKRRSVIVNRRFFHHSVELQKIRSKNIVKVFKKNFFKLRKKH